MLEPLFFHVWVLSGDFFLKKIVFIVLRVLNICKERRVRAPGKCHLLHKYRLLVLTASLVRGILTHMSLWCDPPSSLWHPPK